MLKLYLKSSKKPWKRMIQQLFLEYNERYKPVRNIKEKGELERERYIISKVSKESISWSEEAEMVHKVH